MTPRVRQAQPTQLVSEPNQEHEKGFPGLVAGVDEVGRGPLAGPVVAAAVCLPNENLATDFAWMRRIRDSKALSPVVRYELEVPIRAYCAWALGAASVLEIERLNILEASLLAMERAGYRLRRHLATKQPAKSEENGLSFLIDGTKIPRAMPGPSRALIKGDQKSLAIAAASILAKCCRDRLMTRISKRYPGYGFERHVGYGTAFHREALQRLGPCPHHRQTFAPVRILLEERTALGVSQHTVYRRGHST